MRKALDLTMCCLACMFSMKPVDKMREVPIDDDDDDVD